MNEKLINKNFSMNSDEHMEKNCLKNEIYSFINFEVIIEKIHEESKGTMLQ